MLTLIRLKFIYFRRRRAVRISITHDDNPDSINSLIDRDRQKQLERLTILRRTTLKRGLTAISRESLNRRKLLLQRSSSELNPTAL